MLLLTPPRGTLASASAAGSSVSNVTPKPPYVPRPVGWAAGFAASLVVLTVLADIGIGSRCGNRDASYVVWVLASVVVAPGLFLATLVSAALHRNHRGRWLRAALLIAAGAAFAAAPWWYMA